MVHKTFLIFYSFSVAKIYKNNHWVKEQKLYNSVIIINVSNILISLHNLVTWVWAMMRTTLQYFLIFLRSASMDLRPRSSCHFFDAFVNAFFLLLYLSENQLQCPSMHVSCIHLDISATCQSHRNEWRLNTFLGLAH